MRSSLNITSTAQIYHKEGRDVTYRDAVTKRQRTLSSATDSSLESTVPSVSLTNSDVFNNDSIHYSASIGSPAHSSEHIFELQRKGLDTDRARNTVCS
jgi:hypothetical protein